MLGVDPNTSIGLSASSAVATRIQSTMVNHEYSTRSMLVCLDTQVIVPVPRHDEMRVRKEALRRKETYPPPPRCLTDLVERQRSHHRRVPGHVPLSKQHNVWHLFLTRSLFPVFSLQHFFLLLSLTFSLLSTCVPLLMSTSRSLHGWYSNALLLLPTLPDNAKFKNAKTSERRG